MSTGRYCNTCAHLGVPVDLEPCRECTSVFGLKPNWTHINDTPKPRYDPRWTAAAPTSDTGYGCQTCKFCAVDPNAAPCRGCWSPSVSGKGSNWTAP